MEKRTIVELKKRETVRLNELKALGLEITEDIIKKVRTGIILNYMHDTENTLY